MAVDLQKNVTPSNARFDFNTYPNGNYIVIKFVEVTMNGKTFQVY
jgi:hypothetical protein